MIYAVAEGEEVRTISYYIKVDEHAAASIACAVGIEDVPVDMLL